MMAQVAMQRTSNSQEARQHPSGVPIGAPSGPSASDAVVGRLDASSSDGDSSIDEDSSAGSEESDEFAWFFSGREEGRGDGHLKGSVPVPCRPPAPNSLLPAASFVCCGHTADCLQPVAADWLCAQVGALTGLRVVYAYWGMG